MARRAAALDSAISGQAAQPQERTSLLEWLQVFVLALVPAGKENQMQSQALSNLHLSPVDVVKALYEAYARRDFAAIASLYDPACELEQSSLLPWGGTYRGHAGLQQFFERLTNAIDTQIVDETLFEAGDKVVSMGRTKGVARMAGTAFELPTVHMYTVRNGTISRFEAYVDTPAMQKALGRFQ